MPPRGQMKALPASLPPARRELAQAVRALLHDAGGSLRNVAPQIHSSRSVLHRLAWGKFYIPDADAVVRLHRFAAGKNRGASVALSDLRHLLQRVQVESAAAAEKPAADTVAGTHGGLPAALTAGTGAPFVTPVPAFGGDRRQGLAADQPWPIDELALHMESGRYEHAVGMLDYAGGAAPAVESAAAIQACRARGLTEAADALLQRLRNRPEHDAFAVIRHLIDAGNVADARALAEIRCIQEA